MRTVLVTATLLLVTLVLMPDITAGKNQAVMNVLHSQQKQKLTECVAVTGNLAQLCRNTYPEVPCKTQIGDGAWYQMGDGRCVKAFLNTKHLPFWNAEVKQKHHKQTSAASSSSETITEPNNKNGTKLTKLTSDCVGLPLDYRWITVVLLTPGFVDE